MPSLIRQAANDVLIRVKAVPGASRDQISGTVGDRLKVRVSAPAGGGRANKAICALLAKAVGVPPKEASIERGQTSAEKTVRIHNADADHVRQRLE
ncbi:MAG: DUF167 domain-containing protein [Planctomycetota bacterium]|jgi:uncharacterized protein (TIGR00251 family)